MEFVRLPSLEGLRAFEAAARLGSFEKAGYELNVTPSAVSKRVAAVEELLGQPLFFRGPNTLTMTDTGREYFRQIGEVLQVLLAMPIHQRTQARQNRLRVTVPPTFARQVLVPRLAEFSRRYPDVDLEVIISMPILDAPPTDADVEIRNGDATQPLATQLMTDWVVPMASPELLFQLPPMREPADLARASLLRTPLESWTPWFRAAGLDWPEPTAGPKLVDLGLTIEAAVAAQGVALLRGSLTMNWLSLGRLRALFPLMVEPPNQYYLLPWIRRGHVHDFALWLMEVCRETTQQAKERMQAQISASA